MLGKMIRALNIAVFIMCFNLAVGIVNTIDDFYYQEQGRYLIGQHIEADTEYDVLRDATDQDVNLADKQNVSDASERWVGRNTQGNEVPDEFFLTAALNGITTVFNFFWRGFLGLPSFLTKFGMNNIFVGPLQVIIGLIYATGIYDLKRGAEQ